MDYKNVRDEFIVVPQKGLLRKEGFLPPLQEFDDDLSQLESQGGGESPGAAGEEEKDRGDQGPLLPHRKEPAEPPGVEMVESVQKALEHVQALKQ